MSEPYSDLRSLLLMFESNVVALYDLQRDETVDFFDTEHDAKIAERRATVERARERILAFAKEA